MSDLTINRMLVEMFGIPADATEATLKMIAGQPAMLTVTRVIYRTGQLAEERKQDRYKLVLATDEDDGYMPPN